MAELTAREKAQSSIAENRKAFHDYHLLETFEAGLVLLGTEVKAIREGRVNLRDSFARVEDGEVFLYNVHISPYSHRATPTTSRCAGASCCCTERDPQVDRQDRREGDDAGPDAPLLQDGRVKVAVSLAKGKQDYDKRRERSRSAEADRETRAAVKSRGR